MTVQEYISLLNIRYCGPNTYVITSGTKRVNAYGIVMVEDGKVVLKAGSIIRSFDDFCNTSSLASKPNIDRRAQISTQQRLINEKTYEIVADDFECSSKTDAVKNVALVSTVQSYMFELNEAKCRFTNLSNKRVYATEGSNVIAINADCSVEIIQCNNANLIGKTISDLSVLIKDYNIWVVPSEWTGSFNSDGDMADFSLADVITIIDESDYSSNESVEKEIEDLVEIDDSDDIDYYTEMTTVHMDKDTYVTEVSPLNLSENTMKNQAKYTADAITSKTLKVEIIKPDIEEDNTDKLSAEVTEKIHYTPYTREDFEKDIKLPDEFSLDDLESILKIKHFLLFTAPPGTGKTTAAIALANYILGEKESDRLTVMSFNQATEYSDIVSGLRQDKNGIWKNSNGTIKSVCTNAVKDSGHKYIIVLDEINRGNTLAALGEYLTAMSQIGKNIICNTGETIVMPENVYIIATMNTTDSSVTKLDAALRDRFAMIEMKATNFEVENIKNNIDDKLSKAIKLVISYIEDVNKILAKDMIKGSENQLGMRQLYTDYNTVKELILVVKTCIKPQIDAMSINLVDNDIDEIEKITNILIKALGDIENETF